MPDKSIREMTSSERRYYSLKSRVVRALLCASLLLGLVALTIGFGLYTSALIGQYKVLAHQQAHNAASVLERVVDVEAITEPIMAVYNSMSEDERAAAGSADYRERFAALWENENYQVARDVLGDFYEAGEVNDIYLALYLREPARLLYFIDPDPSPVTGFAPGDWEPVSDKEAAGFLDMEPGEDFYSDLSYTHKYGWMCTAGVQIRNEQGELIGFLLADVTLTEVASGMRLFLLQYFAAMVLAIGLIGWLLIRRIDKTVVRPINEIAQTAQLYVQDKRSGVKMTDHFSLLNIRTGDEIENLSLVMADMERDLAEYEETLTSAVAERERMSTELSLAKRIQAAMLPSVFPPFPERHDFDIFASMTPAKEVGGDFYDFFLLDDEHLGLVMADVSGKGIPGALFMSISKAILKNHAQSGLGPKEALEKLNRQICANNPEEMFVTIWFGVLDLRSGLLTAANAGHEYPVLMQPGGRFEVVKDRHGFVVGGMEGVRYQDYELHLEPNAKLFLYTDGVTEATDAQEQLFGMDRLVAALNTATDCAPREVLARVQAAVDAFVGKAPQFDDLTMLCVAYNGMEDTKR